MMGHISRQIIAKSLAIGAFRITWREETTWTEDAYNPDPGSDRARYRPPELTPNDCDAHQGGIKLLTKDEACS